MKIPRSSGELQSFALGIMAGIAIVVGAVMLVSHMADVKWRAVSGKEWRQEQADKLYGCTLKQQAPNGECP